MEAAVAVVVVEEEEEIWGGVLAFWRSGAFQASEGSVVGSKSEERLRSRVR